MRFLVADSDSTPVLRHHVRGSLSMRKAVRLYGEIFTCLLAGSDRKELVRVCVLPRVIEPLSQFFRAYVSILS